MSKGGPIKSDVVPQVRAVCLSGYMDVAGRLGVDPYEMLRKARIRPEDLTDPETRLAAAAVVGLAEETARQSGCETFGLLMAERRNFASLGPVSLLLQHCGSVRDAIGAVARHQRMLGDLTDYILQDDGEVATFRMELLPGYGQRDTIEFTVGVMFRVLQEMTGGRWRPDCIHFRHAAPVNLKAHKRFFRCPVQFDSDFDGLSCASSALGIANPAADAAMARHAERCLDVLAGQRATTSITEQVQRSINCLIGRCNVTMESVADNLGLHPRMLQRLLEKEGATFAALLNQTRRELAVRYLTGSNQTVTEVGLLLGYSTLSSFSRWFTVEFGQSPAAWRNAERSVPACSRDFGALAPSRRASASSAWA